VKTGFGRVGALIVSLVLSAPAYGEAIFRYDSDVPKATRTNIERGVLAGEQFFARKMGIKFNARFEVIASGNDAFRKSNVPARAYYRPCNGGYANARLFVVCTESEAFNRSQFAGGLRVQQEMISLHEFVHVLQIELSGGVMHGPPWMNEGFAEHVVMLHKVDRRIIRLRDEVNWHAKKARNSGLSLKMLENRGHFNASPDSTSVGMAAVNVLDRKHGLTAFTKYYLEIGKGRDWRRAFSTAFGQSVDQFYAEFRP